MKPHLQYLRYVVLHKLYVFAGGVAVARVRAEQGWSTAWLAWLWRLLVHDLSKFRPSEWRPYVLNFYGEPVADVTLRVMGLDSIGPDHPRWRQFQQSLDGVKRERQARFNVAWMLHIHRNEHHWQHWILHEDSGKTLVLIPAAHVADEMLADWIGAGTKILARPTLAECIAATVTWYAANHNRMQLRDVVRQRIEENLLLLSAKYGLVTAALQLHAAERARASIVIPGR